MKTYKIYQIRCKVTNKRYIGKTKNSVKRRFNEHKYSAQKKLFGKSKLYSAMRKYGVESFEILSIYESTSEKHISDMEKFFISEYDTINSGYNLTKGGTGGDTSKYIDYSKRRSYSGRNNPMFGSNRLGHCAKLWKITTPNDEVEITHNLVQFCEENNLLPNSFRNAFYRNIKYKGYSLERLSSD